MEGNVEAVAEKKHGNRAARVGDGFKEPEIIEESTSHLETRESQLEPIDRKFLELAFAVLQLERRIRSLDVNAEVCRRLMMRQSVLSEYF